MKKINFPLKDGDKVCLRYKHGVETIAGEIAVPHDEPICWTLQGNWYRRSDGEEMTDGSGKVTNVSNFYKWKAKQPGH